MDFRSFTGGGRAFPGEDGGDSVEADGGGDEGSGVHLAGRVELYGFARPGDALRTPTAVTSFMAKVLVSIRLGLPARPT
ncbi:hypothetical protein AHiyo8_pI66370 (plasmid) [Arthrobacter sp. Hiyo8]|nr:hypothetical protein AHiyo8_pI66370 [Arthrobacter sp. Hiyo8]